MVWPKYRSLKTQILASEEVTYIIDTKWDLYKIQNQRVVKKGSKGDFFVPRNFPGIRTGYIRNGSLILLDHEKQVHVYDPIPMQSDNFKLREGFPKKTPTDLSIGGAIMINDEAYVFGDDGYLIYDERFNNVTTKKDLKIDFPNFPIPMKSLFFEGGHTTSFNDKKFLTLFTTNTASWYSQVYTYDLKRKNLVGGGKNLTEYLLNCE